MKPLCKLCDEDHLEVKTEIREAEIKGEKITYEAKYYYCPQLNEEYEDGNLINENLNKARDVYRKAVGLLTIDEIIEIRERLHLSQRDMALLPGMGEVTISRIESKIIQDKSTDDSIRRIDNDPLFFLEKLEINKEKLGKKYYIIKENLKENLNVEEKINIYFNKAMDIYNKNFSNNDYKNK
jgi:putative zinc finger/helix-turn-helix YgiT family protein